MQVDVVEDVIAAFEAAYPDVQVDMLYSGSVELEQRVYAERDAGAIRADVIWAANPAFFLKLKAQDLLLPYESPEMTSTCRPTYETWTTPSSLATFSTWESATTRTWSWKKKLRSHGRSSSSGDRALRCSGTNMSVLQLLRSVIVSKRIPHRELRNNSGVVLRRVQAGETLEVTNYGDVVAILVPPEQGATLRVVPATVKGGFRELPRVAADERSEDALDDLRED